MLESQLSIEVATSRRDINVRPRLIAFKWTEMMKTVTRWITVRFVGFFNAVRYHLFGSIFVVCSVFFFLFAFHADGLVVIDR
jgi:hypothetical protein